MEDEDEYLKKIINDTYNFMDEYHDCFKVFSDFSKFLASIKCNITTLKIRVENLENEINELKSKE